MMKSTAALVLAFITAYATTINATELLRKEDLPPQIAGNPLELLGDVWTFHCPAGGSVTFSVDTVLVAGALGTPLDPEAALVFGSTLLAIHRDEVPCSVEPVCGKGCPAGTLNCTAEGQYALWVFTGNSGATSEDPDCGSAFGIYELTLEVFDGPSGTGTSLPESSVRLGGAPIGRVFTDSTRVYPVGPAIDDGWIFNAPPYAASSVTLEVN